MNAHRNHVAGWKWASASKIKDEYQIPSAALDSFSDLYGLPRLANSDPANPVYSLPALEVILETVPEFHDCNNIA